MALLRTVSAPNTSAESIFAGMRTEHREGDGIWITRIFCLQDNDAIRIRVGQRLQDDRVDDREDRGGGPDAESQSQDGDQRETGLTNQAAEGKAHVGHVRLLPTTPSSVPGVRPCARPWFQTYMKAETAACTVMCQYSRIDVCAHG